MQIVRVMLEAGALRRSTSAWHESFSVGACRTGTHIMALWARQPLSNYCKPSPALSRHALNFAQDIWGPAEYAAKSRFPTANRCCLWIKSSLLLKRPVTREAKNGSWLPAGKSSALWVFSAFCSALWAECYKSVCVLTKWCPANSMCVWFVYIFTANTQNTIIRCCSQEHKTYLTQILRNNESYA